MLSYFIFNNNRPLLDFSFIRSINVQSSLSSLSINRYNADEFPYKTPATMLKKSVLPSSERTIAFVIL